MCSRIPEALNGRDPMRTSESKLPRSAILPRHVALGLFVCDYLFFLNVPLDLASKPERYVPEMTGNHGIVSNLDIRVRALA